MTDGPLDALAARFVLPAKSGVYLTKNELLTLARLTEGSVRINERRRMLADILKSPQNPTELSQLVDRLIAFCQSHLDTWEDLLESYPAAAPFAQPWQVKTRATIDSLEGMREELALSSSR